MLTVDIDLLERQIDALGYCYPQSEDDEDDLDGLINFLSNLKRELEVRDEVKIKRVNT